MRTTTISSATIWNTPRNSISRAQAELTKLSEEIVTGRMSDAGRDLGARSAQAASLHIDLGAYGSAILSNNFTAKRLDQTQSALDSLTKDAQAFLQQLIASHDSGNPVGQHATLALAGFTDTANVFDGQSYLFGGINSAVPPMTDYVDGPKAVVDSAFLAEFGLSQDDPARKTISAADMAAFLDGAFAGLFDDPDWGANWSSASDQAMRSRISPGEALDTSVTANEPAMRKLAMVYTMVSALGVDGLGADARQTVVDKAIELLGTAISGLVGVQADVGIRQNRVADATERLKVQQSIIETRLGSLEGVDPVEAKVRIDTLSTQIEMSYSLTTRIMRLSILNYV